ncbi:hypothetical protein EV193_105475 [Herbihabitans rhizosphaerae]|uniref:SH3 domain-containing protein n=1 Tax=Herbihabitans rhizosphaerae TaxID=1872711 RepID=A0A4Q7KN60_9PSEU|nr:hypothetical protein [Herbihabitans rhizosphaerae]RZS37915.1 hypothetical protein EV193_105475 [Herbihabitans rhizosphaerae]
MGIRYRATLLAAGGAALIATGVVTAVAPSASAAGEDTISGDRATVREYPGRLVLANAVAGDRVRLDGRCGEWVRVRVSTGHAMATPVGWVIRGNLAKASKPGGLDGVPDRCGDDRDRWRDWVGAINAPFHSVREVPADASGDGRTGWRRIVFGTGVTLAPGAECTPSLNYTRRDDAPDTVDPAQRAGDLDLGKVSYRYVTTDGAVALVSAPRPGASYGVWAFVPSQCVQPKGRDHVYFDEPVAQLRTLSGLKVGTSYPDAEIRSRGCTGAVLSPSHPRFGYWPDPQPGNRPGCPR